MNKLKIEKGASRVRRVPLKTTIDGSVADDIELMCQWSENETSYIVTELLRFALAQSDEFQAYKQSRERQPEATLKADGAAKPERLRDRPSAAASPTAVSEAAK
jgi:hypothetical protein